MPKIIEKAVSEKEEIGAQVVLEAGINVFESLSLLAHADQYSGLHEWVYRTSSAMPDELKRNHQTVFDGLFHAIEPDQGAQSFPEYIHNLSAANPLDLRAKMFDVYMRVNCATGNIEPRDSFDEVNIDCDRVLRSTEDYLTFITDRFSPECVNPEAESIAYKLLIDPPVMQKFIVSHMWRMWEEVMEPEWRRVEPLLQQTVQTFQKVDLRGLSLTQAAQAVLDVDDLFEDENLKRKVQNARQINFVPSVHVGPYHFTAGQGNKKWLFFTVRSPRGMTVETPNLNQTEILVRLNALTDETRLKILQLIAEAGPMTSARVMKQLGLSQSAASRHLMQLSATGYLMESRMQGAKQYSINPRRINETLQGISAFLLKK